MPILHKIHRFLLNTETLVLIALFMSLIVLAVAQILLRNVFASGILWAESYVRITVLWIALLGAMLASRDDQHISIDVLVDKLPRRFRTLARRASHLMTSVICFITTWYSIKFVQEEYDYGGIAFGVVPGWLCEAIIPFAFAIIACRYLIAATLPESRSGS